MSADPFTSETRRISIRLPRPLWIGLGTVVVVVAGVGLRIGVPIFRQQVAIQEIERLGGKVEMHPGGPAWLRIWVGDPRMKLFDDVRKVHLNGTQANDATLGHVGWLAKLDWLSLANTPTTDAGIEHLKRLTELHELSLNKMQVTDAALVHLKGLTSLERLWLDATQVTDFGLRHLDGLTGLKELSLENTHVSDAGLVHLKGLTKLELLYLDNTVVTDAGVRELRRALPGLTINW